VANRLARLFSRRSSRPEPPPSVPAIDGGALALDTAAVGPPMLLPAVIFRQVLFDPTEFTPVWLKPRPAPEREPAGPAATTVDEPASAQAAPDDAPKPAKRVRRATTDGTPSRAKPAASPSRPKASRSSTGTSTKRPRRSKDAASDA
jgi:hypothetical protein